jgi:hypothetical protein
VSDPEALIAYTHNETWIIEGELLRVVRVHATKLKAVQQYILSSTRGVRRSSWRSFSVQGGSRQGSASHVKIAANGLSVSKPGNTCDV